MNFPLLIHDLSCYPLCRNVSIEQGPKTCIFVHGEFRLYTEEICDPKKPPASATPVF